MAEVHDSAQLPSGYEENFVNPVDDDLQCSICYLALRDPVLTRCGHRFCKECLERHMTRQESQQQVCNCPVDREQLVHHNDIFPDKATGRKILSLVIKCAGCEWTGELREKKNHLSSCSSKVISCTNVNCKVWTTRNNLEEHVATECQWRIVACDHCSEPHPKCLLQDHVDHCEKKPVECPNSCGKIIVRKEIASHIGNGCPLTVISCPYVQMGCNIKIQRKDIETHVESATRLHLALTCTTFTETTGKLEQTVDALQKQVQELITANSALNAKVDTQREELIAAYAALSSKVDMQEKEILRLTNESSPFVWKITAFSEILRQANSGHTKRIYSEPFYTGKQGYKLRVCVYPVGEHRNENRYLSVFFFIMKGNNDAILPWPFHRKVTFTLIDQYGDPTGRKNVVKFLITDASDGCYARPTTEQNAEMRGFLKFVSHKDLRARRYVVEDTLFLQVEVNPPGFKSCNSNQVSMPSHFNF